MNLQYWKRIQHVILWKCKRYIDVPDSGIPDIKLYKLSYSEKLCKEVVQCSAGSHSGN